MQDILIQNTEIDKILSLRHRILRPTQELAASQYPQDQWESTIHVGAFEGGKVIGAATFHIEQSKVLPASNPYRLRGMATESEWQGRGVGRRVLEHGLSELVEVGCDLLWFNARIGAFPFYERMGFSYHGEFFELPLIGPHKVMFKYIQRN